LIIDRKEMKEQKVINSNYNTGVNSISRAFEDLKKKGHKAFIPFLTCGFPDMEGFIKTFKVLESCGSDIIEIGIPFSDPLSDGPVIQKTSNIAIENGINTDIVFEAITRIRGKSKTPVVILTYFNITYVYGIERFLSNASKAGVNGVIIPDLSLEEYKKYIRYFKASGIDNIMIASLTSDDLRLKSIVKAGRGFIYCVSLKGVTGARNSLSDELVGFLKRLRQNTDLPLAVGFGFSNSDQVKKIKNKCDGIIMGSKILDILLKAKDLDTGLKNMRGFVTEIVKELKS
jgi:tryptophan synthase alpha chain